MERERWQQAVKTTEHFEWTSSSWHGKLNMCFNCVMTSHWILAAMLEKRQSSHLNEEDTRPGGSKGELKVTLHGCAEPGSVLTGSSPVAAPARNVS